MKLFSKETAGIALTGTALYGANQMAPGIVGNALTTTSWAVSGVLEGVWNGIESITEPIIGAAAPTVAPMFAPTVAGIYLWNKIGDYLFNEDAVWKKRAATVAGWVLGASASMSVASPYLVAAAALYAGRKVPLWAAEKVGRGASAVWGGASSFVWWGLKGAGKGAVNGVKNGWSAPSLKPQVGF